MDKIIFPSILNNVIVDKDNLKIKHTREGQAEIETIEGRSEFIEESFSHVGELNQETNKYDIEITTSKEYENGYTEKSSSIISIDKPLKSTPSGLCDKIYKHGDNYKLLTQIGEKPFEQEYNKESLEKGESIVLENSNNNNLIEIEEIWGNTWQDDTDSKNLFGKNVVTNHGASMKNITWSDDNNVSFDINTQSWNGFELILDSTKTYTLSLNFTTSTIEGEPASLRLYGDGINHPLTNGSINRVKYTFSNTSYIRICGISTRGVVNHIEFKDVQIEEGSVATDYVDYHKADLSNIKHLGELYVDEEGNPILDSEGREQYKIEIESRNFYTNDLFYLGNNVSELNLEPNFINTNNVRNSKFTIELECGDFTDGKIIYFKNGYSLELSKVGTFLKLRNFNADVGEKTKMFNCNKGDIISIVYNGNVNLYVNGKFIDNLGWLQYYGNVYVVQNLSFLKINTISVEQKYLLKSEPKTYKTSILLPCQLCKVGDAADRLYWDSEEGKYIVEKNIADPKVFKNLPLTTHTYEINGNKYYSVDFTSPVSFINGTRNILSTKLKYNNLIWGDIDSEGIRAMNNTITIRVLFDKVTDITAFINDMDIYIETSNPQLIETNVLEQAVLPCYKDKTYIDILSNSITGTFKANLLTPKITNFPYIDEINDTISDGTTLLYPLPKNEITETDIEIDNQITTYGTDTTFEFNGAIPKITLNKVPNDYAYNESRSLAKGEVIDVESFEDIDTTKTIEIKSIEGQTYQNLMQDPIKNSIAKYSIDMQGETIEVSDWEAEQDVEIKEIHGNTFVNMLEDKVDSAIVKNIATYQGKTVSLDENYNRFDKLTIDEIQGNTMQNLIVNPNNVEETCEFIYSGNDTTHTIENSTISKITVDELLGNTWQNSDDLSDIRSVGELQEDGSYKIDILSKNNLMSKMIFGSVSNSGILEDSNIIMRPLNYIYLEPNTEYKIEFNKPLESFSIIMNYYRDNGEWSHYSVMYSKDSRLIFTSHASCRKIMFRLENIKPAEYRGIDLEVRFVKTSTEYQSHKTTILLPCQLQKVGDVSDKFYYDSGKGKWCIEKNINQYRYDYDTENYHIAISGQNNNGLTKGFINKPSDKKGNVPLAKINIMCDGIKSLSYEDSINELDMCITNSSDGRPLIISSSTNHNEARVLIEGKTILYQLGTPQIIETEYTNPNLLQFDTYDEVTYIDSTPSDTSIEPNIVINSNGVQRECLLKANTKYTVKFNTSLDSEIDLGGTKLNVLSADNQIEITTPSALVHNQLRVAKESAIIKDLMVLEGTYENELHIPYMEGINSYGDYDEESGKYRVELICYNIDKNEEQKLTFLLDEPLRRIGSISDRLYFDNEKGYYCVERKIEKIKFSNDDIWESAWGETTNYIGIKNTKDLPIDTYNVNLLCDKLPQEQYTSLSSKDYEWVCLANTSINLKIKKNKLTSLDSTGINKYCEDLNILYTTKAPVIEELTEYTSNTLKCYNDKTSIEGNNFISPNLITVTTLPLSTKALIKPNTKYTMFMDTDCDINYNLGGVEGVYINGEGKILISTQSTLSNSTLTLLGEGNVRNVTLLEGDYINSYIPDIFIDEIKSVGDYDEESGKYKVEVIINNLHKKTILLPCQLCKVGDIEDRLYWDSENGKYVVEKNIVNETYKDKTGWSVWYHSEPILRFMTTPTNTPVNSSSLKVLSNKIPSVGYNINQKNIYIANGRLCLILNDNDLTSNDLNGLNDWLEEKELTVYYQLNTPQIIETDITEPLIATLPQGNTIITTENEVKPNLWIYDSGLEKEVSIAPSTTYYLSANTENDIQVDLGGTVVNYLSTDTIKSITTPSILNSNTIKFMGNGYVKDVMLRVDNREDIPYFEGLENVGEYDEVSGKYKIEIISKGTNVVLDEKVIFLNNPLRKGDYILPNGNIIRSDSEDIEIIEDMPIMEFAIEGIRSIDSNNLIKPIISTSIPTKSIRKLEKPTEISIVSNEDKHTISWTGDKGVESYDIRLNDEIIQTVDYTNTSWINNNEMSGDITITAKNHLIESDKSDGLNILTIPNQCKLTSFDCIYKDNLYQMVIGFQKNSNIATGYKIKYILDNGEIVEEELTDLDNVVGQYQISLPVIEDKIDVKIYPYNKAGSNEYKDYKSFYVTPTPLWTYLTSNDNFLFRIKDRFNFETWYNLKTKSSDNMGRFDGSLDWNDYPIGGNEGINGLLIDYTLQTHPEEELLVSAVMNDGEFNHIPSIPFRASKILDITLLAPKGFKMEWVDDGVAKFSWEDNYVNENYFEFSYSLNGGIEEHIRIDSSSVETDGKIYSYTYKFDEYGILSARVRMVWELNTSAYTDSKTATFVEVTGLPPSWIVKKYDGDNLVVSWEAQSYVEKYEVKIECDGATEIFDIVQDMFNLDLNKYHGKDVRISIRTHFTTGLITEYSDSISFKPVSESQVINNISYRPIKVEKDNNVRITTKINEIFTSYQRVVNTINNESVLHTKICKEMIGVEALLNNTFYNIVNEKYSNNIMVSTPNVESKFNIYAKTYKQVEIDKLLNSYIYTPILSKFTDFMSIQKVTIVCIGDSITAGHPLYWAESNTGVIEAQYPYWLSKRLNGQYNVINKGFGSDRTFNVLARFKKDVLDLNPQYCIIQAGTNDIYWGSAEAGDDYTKFDKTLNDMKNNIMQCVQLCFDNDIIPIIGNLIPRTQAVTIPMVKYGLIEFNKWIAEYANETEGVSYVDFFNAGKNSIPPTPLEDPDNPYALNPLYDGDTKYDAQGNVISQGAGIHLNIEGYRIMAEAIPLSYFKATSTGIKMYLDSDCTKEENYNNDDALYPFYTIKLDDLKLGRTKTIVRYLKNIGDSQVVFAMYQANGYNINYTFENEDKSTQDYVSGILLPDRKVKVTMNITPLMEDSKAAITLFVAGRQFTQN